MTVTRHMDAPDAMTQIRCRRGLDAQVQVFQVNMLADIGYHELGGTFPDPAQESGAAALR